MTWDYFIFLETCEPLENTPVAWRLAGGFIDHIFKCFLKTEIKRLEAEKTNDRQGKRQAEREKTRLRKEYMGKVPRRFPVKLYPGLQIDFSTLLSDRWLALQVDFELLTPWYSRDDRIFHVMDNPVRKDRVFGVPFMAASSCKGMLRWACRMHEGLMEYLEQHNGKIDGWWDPDWIQHLFGNEKKEEKNFHQGALVFYPTWFNKIGFEVINPHSRTNRAGTQPIYYEVVPGRTIQVKKKSDGTQEREEVEGAEGTLSLLYAPWPGMEPEAKPVDVLPKLLEAIETLLTPYGISAKRTVGWGTAEIKKWRAFHKTHGSVEKDTRDELWQEVQNWLTKGGTP